MNDTSGHIVVVTKKEFGVHYVVLLFPRAKIDDKVEKIDDKVEYRKLMRQHQKQKLMQLVG